MAVILLPQVDHLHLPGLRSALTVYWILLGLILTVLIAMPIITLDVSVGAPGIIRPASERTYLRSMVTGRIHKLPFKDGDYVQQNSVVMTIENNVSDPKIESAQFELREHASFRRDLEKLTRPGEISLNMLNELESPLYKQQASRYLYELSNLVASVHKVNRELKTDSILFADRVISGKEFNDKQTEASKLTAACNAFISQQKTSWEGALSDISNNQVKLVAQHQQLIDEKDQYEVRAPVSGTLQGLSAKYEGGLVQAGEVLCELSPETDLIAECFIETHDIGFLKVNQQVNFSIDAFNYNFFGVITGKVKSIDNDYTTIGEKPVFKVRCSFDTSQLQLKNGYRGLLKKGLTINARFLIARRTVAQLLFDKLDNWLNPVAVNIIK